MRLTTSAAVTSALSVRNGWDPCPGVPWMWIFDQYEPFSPTITGSFGGPSPGIWNPPASVTT